MAKTYYIRTQNTLQAVLPAVTGVTVSNITAFSATINWNPLPEATGYYYILSVPGGNFGGIGATPITPGTTLTGLVQLTNYTITIAGAFAQGIGPYSAPVQFSTPQNSTKPGMVTGLTATAVSPSQINLAWQADPTATSYNIYQNGLSNEIVTGIADTSYNVSGLSASTNYYYQVTGVNAYGESVPSTSANATTFSAVPGQVQGLTVTGLSPTSAALSWLPTTNATSYSIYRTAVSQSASGATIPSNTYLVDNVGNIWTVVSGVVYLNGGATVSGSVILLLYYNGIIYQENVNNNWWAWTSNTWNSVSGDPRITNPGVPAPAAAVGYNTNTFNSTQIVTSGVGWYPWSFYGENVPASYYTQNGDGSITLQGNTNSGAALCTATKASSADGFTGWVPGGGYYMEFQFSLSNPTASNPGAGPAAIWALDIEHTSQGSAYNVGWPSSPQIQNTDGTGPYDDYIEWDFLEFDNAATVGSNVGFNINGSNWNNHVSGNPLNWGQSNFWAQQYGGSSGSVPLPPTTNLTQKHTVGFLWVPATGSGQTTSTQGYTAHFFDGVQIAGGTQANASANPTDGNKRYSYWNYHDPTDITHYPTPTQAGAPTIPNQGMPGHSGSPPTFGDVCMSIMDWRHMMPIIGGGNTTSMTIYSAKVWQASAANNLQY